MLSGTETLLPIFEPDAGQVTYFTAEGRLSHTQVFIKFRAEPIPLISHNCLCRVFMSVFKSFLELSTFNGENDSPLYLGIMGRVYDVSQGAAFYGPGRSYHHYVGRDATRSYATGCTKPEVCAYKYPHNLLQARTFVGRLMSAVLGNHSLLSSSVQTPILKSSLAPYRTSALLLPWSGYLNCKSRKQCDGGSCMNTTTSIHFWGCYGRME